MRSGSRLKRDPQSINGPSDGDAAHEEQVQRPIVAPLSGARANQGSPMTKIGVIIAVYNRDQDCAGRFGA
jgi:hypothetical protein